MTSGPPPLDPASARAVADASRRITDVPTERLRQLSDDMFDKVTAYVRAELEQTCDSYALLESINAMVAARYRGMNDDMLAANQQLAALYEKHATINDLEDGVAQLEKTVADLDAYTRRLQTKFEQLRAQQQQREAAAAAAAAAANNPR